MYNIRNISNITTITMQSDNNDSNIPTNFSKNNTDSFILLPSKKGIGFISDSGERVYISFIQQSNETQIYSSTEFPKLRSRL